MLSIQGNRAVFFEEVVFGDSLISNGPPSADSCSSMQLVVSIP